jgi:hypothetical protein
MTYVIRALSSKALDLSFGSITRDLKVKNISDLKLKLNIFFFFSTSRLLLLAHD